MSPSPRWWAQSPPIRCPLHRPQHHRMSGLIVTVANGDHLRSPSVCTATPIDIHSESFSIGWFALTLIGYDIVLGVQWLKTLGPITWDFEALTMMFLHQGCPCVWHSISSASVSLAALTTTRDLIMDPLLCDYDDIFTEPSGLPPTRCHDHHNHLVPRTTPIAIRSYRYPQLLEDQIERHCEEILTEGIIYPRDGVVVLFSSAPRQET